MHDEPSLIRFATASLAFHSDTELTSDKPLTREELDALHEHAVALYLLLDHATARTRPHVPTQGNELHNARIRMWQVSEHLHAAYHAAPRADGRMPTREACATRLPEGAPDLTICQRHLKASARIRYFTTPADLHAPAPGMIRR
ncbi:MULTISPECIES: DUF6238 family protein [unclassified Kitasatospora]|uniref:DUF6238 family protein n=1 Tax=unclassified Kitasatospora TaxID=2633591 RepID=UPI000709D95E|nr:MULTISPECIES: DUF6238 family protein [unclassified Kitasatospora]KQV20953.1 hypothetical protein ASC99_20850 [Kitasatospora sp. Root107]KRB60393.1 hypothetical protein ASE03_12330 [Kitasatospora sp. Root187]